MRLVKELYNPDEWLSVNEVAQALGITPSRVRQLVQNGQIRARYHFGTLLIHVSAIRPPAQ